jgi:hypothetical protein
MENNGTNGPKAEEKNTPPAETTQPATTDTINEPIKENTSNLPETTKIEPALESKSDAMGTDKDGTPKLSVNETLNIVSKSIIHIFEDRAKTSLPKITPTEVEKLLAGYEGIKINWQFADFNKTKGRLALVSVENAQDHVLLPLDINEEWEFGVDYELMAREAAERGEKFGAEELAAAKAKHEMDENDKNRLSVEHLNAVAKTIEDIFSERETTCLPKLTDKDVQHVLRNQAKTIGIQVHYNNEEATEGYYLLTEFQNEVRVPKEGNFNFSIDNERVAKKREDALAAEREAARTKK